MTAEEPFYPPQVRYRLAGNVGNVVMWCNRVREENDGSETA